MSPDAATNEAVLEDIQQEPIAIIGFAFKYPQDATDSDSFWKMLVEARCASTPIPPERMNVSSFYHPDPKRHDSFNFRNGHFLKESLEKFDASFFSIQPTEAAAMDPHQRGLLETTYHALEAAGISMDAVRGTATSVYSASFGDDYRVGLFRDADRMPTYSILGTSASTLANRISWFYDLRGASLNVDSACSSSLVAMDQACQNLRAGASNMSIVTGGNVILDPGNLVAHANFGLLSAEGRCFSFDHRASGYSTGEGYGVLILKRLTDAIRDNNCIRAVVRSTGSNSDGRTPGISQPSQEAQEALIRETYRKAGLDMKVTRFFEAHATGTSIGDPIEAGAIGHAFKDSRPRDEPLIVGALKSNIGHLEAGSGVASVIKTILVLESGIIPPNANFEKTNPEIDIGALNIKFPLEPQPWPSTGLRRASVNSFGFGGTNGHAVLEDAYNHLRLRSLTGRHYTNPQPLQSVAASSAVGATQTSATNGHSSPAAEIVTSGNANPVLPRLLVWSAADQDSLNQLVKLYQDHFRRHSVDIAKDQYLERLASTLAAHRTSLPWRTYSVVETSKELPEIRITNSPVKRISKPNLAFVFTGQGAQSAQMGLELLALPAFSSSLTQADAYFSSLGSNWSLLDELRKDEGNTRIHEAEFSQPICTAVQVALVDLLSSLSIFPVAVTGHSSGEIAAAYCCGSISRESAWKIAYQRGVVAASLAHPENPAGAMMAAGLSAEDVAPYFASLKKLFGGCDVVVACVNSPKSITLSGAEEQINALGSILEEAGIFNRKLRVNVPYHSLWMDKVSSKYLELLGSIEAGHSDRSAVMVSSLRGRPVSRDELQSAQYWVDNLTSPVLFSQAIKSLCEPGPSSQVHVDLLLEVGPHSALQGPIRDTTSILSSHPEYTSCLRRKTRHSFFEAMGKLHCLGFPVDVTGLHGDSSLPFLHNLPSYPFNHAQSYWISGVTDKGYRFRKHPRHDLLGIPVPEWAPEDARWRHRITSTEMPWVLDHVVNGAVLYPATGMIAMAIEGAKQTAEPGRPIVGFEIENLHLKTSLVIPKGSDGVETMFSLRRQYDRRTKLSSWSEFILSHYKDDAWVENCRGMISIKYDDISHYFDAKQIAQHQEDFERLSAECKQPVYTDAFYRYLDECGIHWGPDFQCLDQTYCGGKLSAVSKVRLFEESGEDNPSLNYTVHPATLDAILHLHYVGMTKGGTRPIPTMVPAGIRKIWVSNRNLKSPTWTSVQARSTTIFTSSRQSDSTVVALSEETGEVCVVAEGIVSVTVANLESSMGIVLPEQRYHLISWKPDVTLMSQQEFTTIGSTDASQDMRGYFADLTLLSLMCINDALKTISDAEVQEMDSHHQKYVAWIKRKMSEFYSGNLPGASPAWKELMDDPELGKRLYGSVSAASSQGKLFAEVGKSIAAVLRKEISYHELLFSGDLTSNFYRDMFKTAHLDPALISYLGALAHKHPNMNILEIGSGTGGLTEYVLDVLSSNEQGGKLSAPRFRQFCFTDISPAFLDKGRNRFSEYGDRMDYKLFNVQEDPVKQGLDDSYDLILAFGVLHITTDLAQTLKNVRKILRPGGKLIICDPTRPELLRSGFVFGLLPGWWLSTEEYRPWGPLATEDQWGQLLAANGFSGLDLVMHDYPNEDCHELSVFVTTAMQSSSIPKISLVTDTTSSEQMAIADAVRKSMLDLGSPQVDVVSLLSSSSQADVKERLYISLLEYATPMLYDLDEETFENLRTFLLSTKAVLWVTGGAHSNLSSPRLAAAEGFFRALRNEDVSVSYVVLALEPSPKTLQRHVENIRKVVKEMLHASDQEPTVEFREVDGLLQVNRLIEAPSIQDTLCDHRLPFHSVTEQLGSHQALQLEIEKPGQFDTFRFVQVEAAPLAPSEVEVQVKAVGLTNLDSLVATGRLQGTMGGECSGVVIRAGPQSELQPGARVAFCGSGLLGTRARSTSAVAIPDGISFEEAASIPLPFTTAFYALTEVTRVRPRDSILIHNGSSSVGQACIQVALSLSLEAFVTVATSEESELLQRLFSLPANRIICGQPFAAEVKRLTQGKGVNIVLNTLDEDGTMASWDCLAPFGRFVEVGPDFKSNARRLNLPNSSNLSYHTTDIFSLVKHVPELAKKLLKDAMSLFTTGRGQISQPLSQYPSSQAPDAFRKLLDLGKTVITFSESDIVKKELIRKPMFSFDENATYVVSGGLGTCGRVISEWMVERGAKHLLLLSRSGVAAAPAFVESLRQRGAQIEAPPCNVGQVSSLRSVLEAAKATMPPIKGCIQAAVVIDNVIFTRMSYTQWRSVTGAKFAGSWNLHQELPKGMDFFILLSSMSGCIGFQSQAHYDAGNAFQDQLARHRLAQGERGVSLNLGPIDLDGPNYRTANFRDLVFNSGFHLKQSADDLCDLLELVCSEEKAALRPQSHSQIVMGIEDPARVRAKGRSEPIWMQKALFSHFYTRGSGVSNDGAADSRRKAPNSAGPKLAAATTDADAAKVVTEALIQELSGVLGRAPDAFELHQPLHAYGLDSLVAVDVRNWFAREFKADVPVFDLMGTTTLEEIGQMVSQRSPYRKKD
ncbi:reducing type I polyketide synthase [Stachybotrys elegans]|uniref:Reducing type I polyketide synthase n=1 Tax=Stachybotrys elegans TaxID=80388 RepID=A0A8K0SG59_9HYPO|nr:reducing type I polyketide synthase [Stachybotrys elegans]